MAGKLKINELHWEKTATSWCAQSKLFNDTLYRTADNLISTLRRTKTESLGEIGPNVNGSGKKFDFCRRWEWNLWTASNPQCVEWNFCATRTDRAILTLSSWTLSFAQFCFIVCETVSIGKHFTLLLLWCGGISSWYTIRREWMERIFRIFKVKMFPTFPSLLHWPPARASSGDDDDDLPHVSIWWAWTCDHRVDAVDGWGGDVNKKVEVFAPLKIQLLFDRTFIIFHFHRVSWRRARKMWSWRRELKMLWQNTSMERGALRWSERIYALAHFSVSTIIFSSVQFEPSKLTGWVRAAVDETSQFPL